MATVKFRPSPSERMGLAEMYVRVVSGNISLLCKSGIRIRVEYWSEKKQSLQVPRLCSDAIRNECRDQQTQLLNLQKFIYDAINSVDRSKINREWLLCLVESCNNPKQVTANTLTAAFEEYLTEWVNSGKNSADILVVKRILTRFELYTKQHLTNDVDVEVMRGIENFIRNEWTLTNNARYMRALEAVPESRPPKPRGNNTVSKQMSHIKVFVKWCEKKHYIPVGAVDDYEVQGERYGRPYYITIDERNIIADVPLPPALAVQRDIFIFQCLTGCRVSDLYSLTVNSVVDGAIEYIPRKTIDHPTTVRVPLNKQAQQIVARYADRTNDDRLFPFIAKQNYNYAIKEIFTRAGINRLVMVYNSLTNKSEQHPINEIASSHMARRAFIGNLYKQVKDPNLIGSMTGHVEGSKAFSRYRDIDEDMKREVVDLL